MNSLFRKIKNYVIFSPTAQENDFKLKNKNKLKHLHNTKI